MSFFASLDISASALRAQRIRQTVVANNLANANTTRGKGGEPYRRQEVIFQAGVPDKGMARGVHVSAVVPDQSDFIRVYKPGHPDADADGMVKMPNVNPIIEMVDMMTAMRSYEANVTAMDATKSMFTQAYRILA
jgi:flagellar basal-body rod protein FlgC